MLSIRSHLGLARHVRISNVWLLEAPDGRRFLVDTGHRLERTALRLHLWRAGIRRRGDLAAIILTHRHSDHAGNATWLRRTFDCPVVCHADDAAVLSGRQPAPVMATSSRPAWALPLCHIEDRFPARVTVDEVLEDSQIWRGFRVFSTPGHTAGSVLLHHEPTRTLFSGDSILGGPPTFRVLERMRLSLDDFSDDGAQARAAVRDVLGELPATDTLASGHGPAICEDVEVKLHRLHRRDILQPSWRFRHS